MITFIGFFVRIMLFYNAYLYIVFRGKVVISIREKNATNKPTVETRFIASSPDDVLPSLIELVLVVIMGNNI